MTRDHNLITFGILAVCLDPKASTAEAKSSTPKIHVVNLPLRPPALPFGQALKKPDSITRKSLSPFAPTIELGENEINRRPQSRRE